MTSLLTFTLCLLFAYAMYIAVQCSRKAKAIGDHLDAGRNLSSWTTIFAASGVLLAAFGLADHLRMLSHYGFQLNQLALGFILIALCGALFQRRLWLAAQVRSAMTPGELFGAYYQSPTIRIYLLVVLFLFSIVLPAGFLNQAGEVLAQATGGALPRPQAIASLAFFLFLFSAIGGWRAVVYVAAGLSLLVLVLMIFVAGFMAATFDSIAVLQRGFTTSQGILGDAIPGVIQYSKGIGKDMTAGGLWTTVAALSSAIAMAGIALSPGFNFLGFTTRTKTGFAFSQVWVTAGLATGVLILLTPFISAELAANSNEAAPFGPLIGKLGSFDPVIAVCFVLMLIASLLVAICFFAASGANICTIELLDRFVIPGMTGRDKRLAARIMLAAIYLLAALLAAFLPMITAIASTLNFSLSVQLFPAFLGLCWLPWISRSAVLTGLIVGTILVVFTEPPGLILFDGLFADLPWGRWPLTIHSAAWGLAFNLAACLLVALFTRAGSEREHREELHAIFRRDHWLDFGGRAARGAKWSLTLLWTFFALGPGAILGNTFFSKPVFTSGDAALGIPSLWVWQIVFWIAGVFLVWWLAYQSRMSLIETAKLRTGELTEAPRRFGALPQPKWIDLLMARIARRSDIAWKE